MQNPLEIVKHWNRKKLGSIAVVILALLSFYLVLTSSFAFRHWYFPL